MLATTEVTNAAPDAAPITEISPAPLDALSDQLANLARQTEEALRQKDAEIREGYRRHVRKAADGESLSNAEAAKLQASFERMEIQFADFEADVKSLVNLRERAERIVFDQAEFDSRRAELRRQVEAAKRSHKQAEEAVVAAREAWTQANRDISRFEAKRASVLDAMKQNARIFAGPDGELLHPNEVGVESSTSNRTQRKNAS